MPSRIGVSTVDLPLATRSALARAAQLGFGSVEVGTLEADVHPRTLTRSGRRDLVRHVRNLGLHLAALSADPADAQPLSTASLEARADHARAVLEMAADTGAQLVTVRLGLPLDPVARRPAAPAVELVRFLAAHADRVGAHLALRVGEDDPADVAALLHDLSCPALRVCLDPTALRLAGWEVGAAVRSLAGHVALAHVRDAIFGGPSGRALETNLGRGEVDLRTYLSALAEAGYAGPYIIRRADSAHPAADLAQSKAYLGTLLTRSAG